MAEAKPEAKFVAREPLIANGILRTLREWKRINDVRFKDQRPFVVKDEDLTQLENWAAELNNQWYECRETMERNGFEVVERKTAIHRKRPFD